MLPDNGALICIFTCSSIIVFLHFCMATINSSYEDITANSTLFNVFHKTLTISCAVR